MYRTKFSTFKIKSMGLTKSSFFVISTILNAVCFFKLKYFQKVLICNHFIGNYFDSVDINELKSINRY